MGNSGVNGKAKETIDDIKLPIVILTHWGRVTHICFGKLTIIGSDNGLSPGRRQAIIWTNAGILLIRTLGTNFSEIRGEIHSFSFSKMLLKMSSAKWRLFGLGLNELILKALSQVCSLLRHRNKTRIRLFPINPATTKHFINGRTAVSSPFQSDANFFIAVVFMVQFIGNIYRKGGVQFMF